MTLGVDHCVEPGNVFRIPLMQPDYYFELINTADDLEHLALTVPDDWSQGRTVFGGLSAGLLYQVLKKVVPDQRALRSITFNFVAPLAAGQAFTFAWQILRSGKNATQVSASIVQAGQVCLSALGCFAVDRESSVAVEPAPTQLPPFPERFESLREIPPGAPQFTRYIDLHISQGDTPFTASRNTSLAGWMRLREPPIAFTDAHAIVLIDAWPPTVLQMLPGPAPASTMSWNIEFVHPHKPLRPDAWLAYEAKTVQAYGGYAHSEAGIFSGDGELMVISRQLIAVFG